MSETHLHGNFYRCDDCGDTFDEKGGEHRCEGSREEILERLGEAQAEIARLEEALSNAGKGAVAGYEGLMRMARVIGARERAMPLPPIEGRLCGARIGRYKCNFDHPDGAEHKAIGRRGVVLCSWRSPT